MSEWWQIVGWNLAIASVITVLVLTLGRTRWLLHRPGLEHALWILVLAKLVMPPLFGIPLLGERGTDAAQVPRDMKEQRASWNGDPASKSPSEEGPPRIEEQRFDTRLPEHVPSGSDEAGDSRTSSAVSDPASKPRFSDRPAAITRGLMPLALAFSIAGTVFLILRALWSIRKIDRVISGQPAHPTGRVAELTAEVSRSFALPGSPEVLIVDAPLVPLLWPRWFGKPTIILPSALVDSLDDDALRHVIAHEIAHHVRLDPLTNVIGFLISALCWWNPLTWFARRRAARAAETCCDTIAIQRLQSSRKAYAQTLLASVDFLSGAGGPQPDLLTGFGERKSLKRRIEMIADPNVNARVPGIAWVMLLAALAGASFLPVSAQTEPAGFEDPSPRRYSNSPEGEPLAENPAGQERKPQDPNTSLTALPAGNTGGRHVANSTSFVPLTDLDLEDLSETLTTLTLRGRAAYGVDQVTDEGIQHLTRLTNLRVLELSGLGLTDKALEAIGQIASLEELEMHSNRITGDGLHHLKGLTKLRRLRLGFYRRGNEDIPLDDEDFASLANLTTLTELSVDGRYPVTDQVLEYCGRLRNLERLEVSEHMGAVTDRGLSHITGLRRLKNLSLRDAPQVSDAGLAQLANLNHLEHLSLHNLQSVTPTGLHVIGELTELRRLEIVSVRMDEQAVRHLAPLKKLQTLLLWSISSRRLPLGVLGELSSLRELRTNQPLSSTAIRDLAKLKHLESIRDELTNITDEDLIELAQLPELRLLVLDSDRITSASIPTLATMKSLRHLLVTDKVQITPPQWARLGEDLLPRCRIAHWLPPYTVHYEPEPDMN